MAEPPQIQGPELARPSAPAKAGLSSLTELSTGDRRKSPGPSLASTWAWEAVCSSPLEQERKGEDQSTHCSQHVGHRGPCAGMPCREGHEDGVQLEIKPPLPGACSSLVLSVVPIFTSSLSALPLLSLAPCYSVWSVDQEHQHHLGAC